jgi:hypothetical protein
VASSYRCRHCGHWDWEGSDWWHKRTFGHDFERDEVQEEGNVREYYKAHQRTKSLEPDDDGCDACRKARTFASLIGVDLDKEDEE